LDATAEQFTLDHATAASEVRREEALSMELLKSMAELLDDSYKRIQIRSSDYLIFI
jgi:hypothetical protein